MSRSAPEAMVENTLAPSPDDARPDVRAGDVLMVEAATAELALQDVAAKLGERAEIISAERVRRGGVAGFFSQELCRLTVRVPGGGMQHGDAAGDAAAVRAAAAAPGPTSLEDALLRMTAAASDREADERADFSAMLRAQMVDEPSPSSRAAQAAQVAREAQADLLRGADSVRAAPEHLGVAPLPTTPEPAQAAVKAPRIGWTRDPGAPEGTGPVRWSAGMLERLGLPTAVIAAVEAQEPVDDAGWLVAVAAAVAPYCRPLPAGAAVLAGPRAQALAQALDLPVTKRPDTPAAEGTVCVTLRDTLPARDWLADVRGSRWLHVVVGGTGWHGLLFDEPLAVSWVGADALPAALHQCAAFGLVLGYGLAGAGAELLRANPLDVALSVRSLLPRR